MVDIGDLVTGVFVLIFVGVFVFVAMDTFMTAKKKLIKKHD